jgi:hypothetical protein
MAADRVAAPNLLDLPALCQHYLGGSIDLLKGLHQLMRPDPNTLQLPMLAFYPLMRGVIESSGQVVWVLGPDVRRERFRRLLQLQKAELDFDNRYIDVLARKRDEDTSEFRSGVDALCREYKRKGRKRWQRLLDAATVLGLDRADFEHGLSGGYEAVIRQAADERGPRRRIPRSAPHVDLGVRQRSVTPSMSRAWAGSINTRGAVGPDGYMPINSTANPTIIREVLTMAIGLHLRAMMLWKNAATISAPTDIVRDS